MCSKVEDDFNIKCQQMTWVFYELSTIIWLLSVVRTLKDLLFKNRKWLVDAFNNAFFLNESFHKNVMIFFSKAK